MKTPKKLFLLVAAAFLLASPVFSGGTKEEGGESPAQESGQKAEKIKLVYLSKWNVGEVIQGIVNDTIDGYMNDNPTVEVEKIWAGREVNVKLMSMIQAGNPPDIYDEDPPIIENSLGKDGLALDLKPYMMKEKGWNDDKTVWDSYPVGALDPWTYNGEIHCFPYMQYIAMFWYNKTLFKQLGINGTPDTWDEFLDLCEEIKSKGVAPLGQDGGIDFYNLYYFSILADRYEGAGALREAIYDKSGASWDKPGFLKAAQQVKVLADNDYFIKGFEGYQFPSGQIDWAQNKAAMLLIHSYMPIEVADAVPSDFAFGCFSVPSVEGGKGKQYDLNVVVNGPAILKSTKNPDAAFDLLKRFMSLEMQSRIASEAQNMPTRVGVPLPDIFADLGDALEKQTGAFADYAGGPGQFEPELAQAVIFPLDDKLIFGKISAEEFIKQVKEKSIAYWKNK